MNIIMKSSQELSPETDSDFTPKSFVIFCLDQDGNIAFEASWGNTNEDIKKFAVLLQQINSGEFENDVLVQLKEQSLTIKNGTKQFGLFSKNYKQLNSISDLVIDPTEVELN